MRSSTRTKTRTLTHRTLAVFALSFLALVTSTGWAAQLSFAERTWNIKASSSPAGPGPNRFSASANDVWVDQDGLHLTIHQYGGVWYCTEVILQEHLGYGTYLFQTTTRQDILNANAVFGAFTWDSFGDSLIPGDPNREIDFEDSRWGYPTDPTSSQAVVQPSNIGGHRQRITIPDLSEDADLTRYFTWSPNQVEFTSARGHHLPSDVPAEDVFHHWVYAATGTGRQVPTPSRENFRFNLWLTSGTPPVGDQPVEVVISDFLFIPLLAGDYDGSGTVGPEDYDVWKANFGQTQVRFSGADGNGDGLIGAADYVVWRNNFGANILAAASSGGNAMAAAAPEPAGMALIVCAAALVAIGRPSTRNSSWCPDCRAPAHR